jgi:N-acetylglucosaminyldiphosphoundecaprenol N-acetyl-beta-D-mannosaminyltransferase
MLKAESKGVVNLKGVGFHAITEEQCVHRLFAAMDSGRGGWILTPNLNILRHSRKLPIRRLIKKADLVVADGMPIVWASRLQGTPLPARVAGSNLISSISAEASRRKRSIYLLGGSPGTAEGARDVLVRRHPGLRIAGLYCPDYGFEKKPYSIERIRADIAAARPDLVFVALSFPKGERVIEQLKNQFPHIWWLGVGVSFSFLCGHVRRAPLWVQRRGFEWLHRFAQEPRRLCKRYFLEGMPFAASLLGGALWRRYGLSLRAFGHLLRLERTGGGV